MPIYEFKCSKCSHTFEKYLASQGEAGKGGEACPECGEGKTEKVFSLFSSQCGAAAGVPAGGSSGGGCGSGGFS